MKTVVLCLLGVLGAGCAAGDARAQEPAAPQTVSPAQLQAAIAKLGDLDYATRTTASRTVRRTAPAQAVPALLQAVSEQADGYVRYRALILLTGFNDPRTRDAMRESLASTNDRLRTVAYSFFEHNPDRAMLPPFMTRSTRSRRSSSAPRWCAPSPRSPRARRATTSSSPARPWCARFRAARTSSAAR